MKQARLTIDVHAPNTDETPRPGESPRKLVARLSLEKAESVRSQALKKYPQSLIIAADTIVVAPQGRVILGKPESEAEACKTLKLLAGKTHTVLTGYCILHATSKPNGKRHVQVVQSKVKMRSLTPKMIRSYVSTGEPMDKAGSYGAQGLGMALIERIEGSYTNVVGLPMAQILEDLDQIFKMNLFGWIE